MSLSRLGVVREPLRRHEFVQWVCFLCSMEGPSTDLLMFGHDAVSRVLPDVPHSHNAIEHDHVDLMNPKAAL